MSILGRTHRLHSIASVKFFVRCTGVKHQTQASEEHPMDEKQLLETWEIHNRINLYLLDAVEPAGPC